MGGPRILVTGATGTVGAALIACLTRQRRAVRGAARHLPRGAARCPGVEYVAADLASGAGLAEALAAVEVLFLLTPLGPAMVAMVEAAVAAARAAGVRRVVRLSALGAGPHPATRLARVHREAEACIEAAGLEWVHLRPNAFMDNYRLQHGVEIRTEGLIRAPQGTGRVSLVDAADIAEAAARVLIDPAATAQAWELTGPEALDNHQVAARIGAARGAPVRYRDVDPALARTALAAAGLDAWLVETVLELYALSRCGGAQRVSPDLGRLLGRPPRSFAEFAREHFAPGGP